MIRRVIGWLLLAGSPGFAATTFVLLGVGLRLALGNPPVWAAGLVVFGNFMFAVVGTGGGAYLLTDRPDDHRFRIVGAGAAGGAILMPCVYVAEKVLKWI